MDIILLVFTVLSAYFLLNLISGFIKSKLRGKWYFNILGFVAGVAVGLVYLYFAGYYVMGKTSIPLVSFIVALAPSAVFLGIQLTSKAKLIAD